MWGQGAYLSGLAGTRRTRLSGNSAWAKRSLETTGLGLRYDESFVYEFKVGVFDSFSLRDGRCAFSPKPSIPPET